MIQTISEHQFIDAFRTHERKDSFTYKGKQALYDYLTDLEEDTSTPIELDIIALCCEYSEYGSLEEIKSTYDILSGVETLREAIDILQDHTQIICADEDCILIQQF